MNKPRIIIGLSGLAGAGKDTVADFLLAQHDFTKMAFGDALKQTEELEKRIKSTVGNIVVTSVHFDDQAELISKLNGHIWQINRRNIAAVNPHSSERGISPYFIDQNINNYGDIRSLHIICELHLQSTIQHQSRSLWGHA
ncbi:hypothetical protein [Iodobacter fluviatilis]|uniref:Dephospho-CoA kinase n=1 Tax=Iodobacter fluviatilis TaxID=537 RepID=A0A7G3GBI3_9NEIS|nr:hypothetical protein [Iodobacter fluviatilis]QBC44433.1 hypothetical protein C1H71_13440 [Iodobacter fluviatilis]